LERLEDRCLLSYAIHEFSLPAGTGPDNMAAGPDGNVWFREDGPTAIGRITPAGVFTELPTPFHVGTFVFGPDGNIWFSSRVVSGDKHIYEMTTQGSLLHDYDIPSSSSQPDWVGPGLALGADGNIWYTEAYGVNIVGRLTPDGQITEFALPWNGGPII